MKVTNFGNGIDVYRIDSFEFEFHYDYIRNKYGKNSKLLFTGTLILMFKIKKEDIYKDFSKDKEICF